mmetsp:Transcript_31820/g.74972  ORF Transcript_31820/g.74972 Transcript_31820/m.74972 type:complete len:247 (-) Transcript_31820:434-1174(-)
MLHVFWIRQRPCDARARADLGVNRGVSWLLRLPVRRLVGLPGVVPDQRGNEAAGEHEEWEQNAQQQAEVHAIVVVVVVVDRSWCCGCWQANDPRRHARRGERSVPRRVVDGIGDFSAVRDARGEAVSCRLRSRLDLERHVEVGAPRRVADSKERDRLPAECQRVGDDLDKARALLLEEGSVDGVASEPQRHLHARLSSHLHRHRHHPARIAPNRTAPSPDRRICSEVHLHGSSHIRLIPRRWARRV